jgi:hypothetical protein
LNVEGKKGLVSGGVDMLAAYKTQEKQSKSGSGAAFKARRTTGRSTSPKGHTGGDEAASQNRIQLGNMNALLAQPSWALHLQSKIATVTDPEQLQQLRGAMLEFSAQNSSWTTDFLLPEECRYVADGVFCSVGRCVLSH